MNGMTNESINDGGGTPLQGGPDLTQAIYSETDRSHKTALAMMQARYGGGSGRGTPDGNYQGAPEKVVQNP